MQTDSPCSELADSRVYAFLSFVTNDKLLVDEFRDVLESRHPILELTDHAVKARYDKSWKLRCAEKIDRALILLCLVGATTHRSESVAWEIDRGLSRGKRVIAINLMDDQVHLPDILIRNAISPISHNSIHEIDFACSSLQWRSESPSLTVNRQAM